MPRQGSSSALRSELERAIRTGRCAYCRRAASPEEPLTREHVIPRAKGGSRKDVRIIVPACARCNHRRGCRELVLFLLLRPRRISAFLDYLSTLSPDSVRQMDLRVFAELYAAVWMLDESQRHGQEWRSHLKRMCSGRTLHRRRYAARRVVGTVEDRVESLRERGEYQGGPSCPIPTTTTTGTPQLEESLEQLGARLLGILSLAWQVSSEEIEREMARQQDRSRGVSEASKGEAGVLRLDGWRPRRGRRRTRVDRRRGRGTRRAGRAA